MTKKYPFVKQTGLKDCGPATLLMIIKYYKGSISLDNLTDLTKTDRNGTTAYHMIEAAKTLGFEGHGIKATLDELKGVPLPCIASTLIDSTYKHFVVIYEINFKKKYLLIADPDSKIKKISFVDFLSIYENIIIVLTPDKPLLKLEKEVKFISFITNVITNYKKEMFNIIILSFFLTFFSICTSFYFKFMIDGLTKTNHYLILLFIMFLVIYVLKIITDYFRNILLIYVNQKIDFNLTMDTFKNIIYLPYHYYHNRTTGEIVSKINELNITKDIISKVIITVFIDLPLTIIAFILLLLINKTLFFISFIILILYLLIVFIFKPIYIKLLEKIQTKKASINSYMVESISSFKTIKGLNIEENVIKKFEYKYSKYIKDNLKFSKYYNLQYTLKEIVNSIGFITIILVGTLLINNTTITIGTLLTFNALLVYFLEPIRNIIDLDTDIKEASIALKKICNLYHYQEDNGLIDKQLKGNIRINNLTFSYDDNNNVLKEVTTNFKSGNKVMIIGQSGSGKSTILNLIMKYYPVAKNQIYIDDIDINDLKKSSIDQTVIYITQNENLFTDTVLNNLKLNRQVSDNDVLNISKLCCVDEIITKHNMNYHMIIEENGFNLSGGEKQRIILARALLSKFNILVIDEGLNQVDINLERKILKNIFNKFKDKTIIIISHRLENMDLFDQVVELKDGTIIKDVIKNG